MITTVQLIEALEERNGYPFDDPQKEAINHVEGPLWVLAGPGTGKTEVLVARTLRLLCCDQVDPRSIIVTTYTKKAGRSLEDRIALRLAFLANRFETIRSIDTSGLRVGTFHSLYNEILQDSRYGPYRNQRLLNEEESLMFFRHQVARFARDNSAVIQEWLPFLFPPTQNNRPPSLWDWAEVAQTLTNRVAEDMLSFERMRQAGRGPSALATLTEHVWQSLGARARCNYARLQAIFFEFLSSDAGQRFLDGNIELGVPPITHVLVDEYQDSNPVREAICFALAGRAPHNLMVVGDDDQALYRFQGATVEAMVSFPQRCLGRWGERPNVIQLKDNHRSHQQIVTWCNDYLLSFPLITGPGGRAEGKERMECSSGIQGNYPAVGILARGTVNDLATATASFVFDLADRGIVEDYSQIAILLRSTREGPQGAGPYATALRALGVPVYNPRARAFLEQEEVQAILGLVSLIVDPDQVAFNGLDQRDRVRPLVSSWRVSAEALIPQYPTLADYLRFSMDRVRGMQLNETLTASMPTMLYRMLTLGPFPAWQGDPIRDARLSKVTRLLEAFCAEVGRRLKADAEIPGRISHFWTSDFYYVLCGFCARQSLNDDEDDEVICPRGAVPIMTVHQAKGLEFDFVLVSNLGRQPRVSDAHHLEQQLSPLRVVPPPIPVDATSLAWQDDIRLHYVAYSRAKHALILLMQNAHFGASGSGERTAAFGSWGGRGARDRLRVL